MSAATLLVGEPNAVVVAEAGHGVVGVEKSDLGRVRQAVTSEHLDVRPAKMPRLAARSQKERSLALTNQEMERMLALPKGAAEMGPMASLPPVRTRGCPGRKGLRCSAQQIGLEARSVSAGHKKTRRTKTHP